MVSGLQLYLDYNSGIERIQRDLGYIKLVSQAPLSESVWKLDDEATDIQLRGLVRHPTIDHVELSLFGGGSRETGSRQSGRSIVVNYKLRYSDQEETFHDLGTVRIEASLSPLLQGLLEKALIVLGTNLVMILFLVSVIYVLVHILFTRQLHALVGYVRALDLEKMKSPFEFQRKYHSGRYDEFDEIAFALNEMQENLTSTYGMIVEHKDHLEEKIVERTQHLEQQITEREYAEASLRLSEERFKDVAEVASDYIWEMNSKLNFSYISERFFDDTQLSRDDIIGKPRLDFVNAKKLKSNSKKGLRHQRVLEARHPFANFETSLKTNTGESIHLAVSGKPVFADDEEFLGYRGAARNITNQVIAETALRESEARLLRILDNSPFGVSIVSPISKQRLYVNLRFNELFGGTSTEQVFERDLAESYVDPDALERHWAEVDKNGFISGHEEQRKRLDGTVWWCLTDWSIITYGGEASVMVWHLDITERKRAEEEIGHKSELIGLLRTTATNANRSTNFDEALQSCLSTIAEFTNWPVGHIYVMSETEENVLVSSGIWHLDHPKRFEVFRSITERTQMLPGQGFVTRVFTTGEPLWIEDVTNHPNYSRTKGSDQDIRVRAGFALPVKAQGKVVAVLEFYSDQVIAPNDELLQSLIHIGTQLGPVFERKQAEKGLRQAMDEVDEANRSLEIKIQERTFELNAAKDQAERASQTKSEFLANMSHELRTPLNAIIGFSEMIKEAMFGPLQVQYQDYAKDINDSGEHLLGIIADILDLSKVEAGELEIEVEEVDVEKASAACKTMVQGRVEEAMIDLIFDVTPDLPPIYADPLRLKQILLNLIGNAIKFTPEGGTITVSGEVYCEGGVALVVKDTGIGIAKQDIPKVMEKFGQVRGGHTHAHEGAGLGLAMSNSLMMQHGGTLSIESKIGKGTIVTLVFPPERTKISPSCCGQ